MVNKVNTVLATLIIALVCVNLSFAQVPEVKVAAEDTTKKEDDDQEEDSKKKTPKGKPFEDIIEDYQSIEGLFNL
ncbi:hypothetical protein GWN26_15530, partial [Candidatus Saccharibacteria bacterium]|nr:hypothetical protein [Candidatus Saccharibacteria bacterium]NIV72256.1 hypothetical protein [Calditrichia bacterium]NIW00453.1 hypothetical protein [Candidatus Saccharibacteria bacterium]NIW79516.1 hypothetical protein [Calditrichia bacterium]